MSKSYEIEIKTLLGSEDNANSLKDKISKSGLGFSLSPKHKQLNHYFNLPADLKPLYENLRFLIPEDKQDLFKEILLTSKKMSVRTRDADGKIIFVMKASLGDDTSANGVSRVEFEAVVPVQSLDELDKILLDSGLTYQAKWSREREEYVSKDVHICIDKNAGYGYLAEFEKVVSDADTQDATKKELVSLMDSMGVRELPQDRLERMFAHYNAHWQDYYGTEKIFNIE